MGLGKRGGCPLLLLVRILLNVTVSATQSGLQAFSSIQFDPPFVHDLIAGKNTTVQVTVGIDPRHEAYPYMLKKLPWRIQLKSMDEEVASVFDNEKELNFRQLNANASQNLKTNFTLTGHFLGKTALRVRLLAADEDGDSDEMYNKQLVPVGSPQQSGGQVLDVWVSQERNRLINKIFISTLIILIVIANVLMGCELDLKVVLETVKKPVAPTIGFVCQFLVMPLLAYGIAHVVFVSRGLNSFALGLFVTGCAPGGGASNYWTLLLEGNLHVSVTMTFVSTLAAVVMMPLWMGALGKHFLRGYGTDAQIKVPYTKIVSSLLTLVIPLLIGILISRWKPTLKEKARKFMRPFILFVLVFLVVFGTIANLYMLRLLTWTAVMGGLLLPWCGFTFGCFTAVIMRQPPPNVTAIAIETGIQNTGVAIMLLKFSFPEPDADISSLIPVIAASLTPFPLLGAVAVHAVMRRLRYTDNKQQQSDGMVVECDIPDKTAIPSVLEVEEGSPLVQRSKNTLNLPISAHPNPPSDASLATQITVLDA